VEEDFTGRQIGKITLQGDKQGKENFTGRQIGDREWYRETKR
jgi:hypothetical protein